MDQKNHDDTLYEYVFEEMEQGIEPIKSLWAKALAFSEGNDNKAKSLYMQYRVQAIKDQLSTLQIDMDDISKEELSELIKNGFAVIPQKLQIIKEQKAEAKEQAIKIAQEEVVKQEAEEYGKFGGWLLIFAIFLVLGNLYGLLNVESYFENGNIDTLKLLYQNGMDGQVLLFNTIAYISFASYGLLLAFTFLFFRKHRDTKDFSTYYFGYNIIAAPIVAFLLLKIDLPSINVMSVIVGASFKVLFSLIWLRYFMLSERVKKTFIRGDDENDNGFVIAFLLGIAAIIIATILYAKASDKGTLTYDKNVTSTVQASTEGALFVTSEAAAPVAEAAVPVAEEATPEESRSVLSEDLEQDCNNGRMRQCTELGLKYADGQGVQKDDFKAVRLFKKSCDGGDTNGCYYEGLHILDGKGIPQNKTLALEFLKKSCDGGNTDGCSMVGMKCEDSSVAKIYALKGVAIHKKACSNGDAQGCTEVSHYYSSGFMGLEVDMAIAKAYAVKSFELNKKACSRGNALSCSEVGQNYMSGGVVQKNIILGKNFLMKGCNGGDSNGCRWLGGEYEYGSNFEKDYNKAAEYYKKACDAGFCGSYESFLNENH